jgi:hypothetical protein
VTKQSFLFHPVSAYHQRGVMRVPFLLSSESPQWANFTNTFSEVLLMLLGMTEGLNRTFDQLLYSNLIVTLSKKYWETAKIGPKSNRKRHPGELWTRV